MFLSECGDAFANAYEQCDELSLDFMNGRTENLDELAKMLDSQSKLISKAAMIVQMQKQIRE
jgi:hypothetical protein